MVSICSPPRFILFSLISKPISINPYPFIGHSPCFVTLPPQNLTHVTSPLNISPKIVNKAARSNISCLMTPVDPPDSPPGSASHGSPSNSASPTNQGLDSGTKALLNLSFRDQDPLPHDNSSSHAAPLQESSFECATSREMFAKTVNELAPFYHIETSLIDSPHLRSSFVASSVDEQTHRFMSKYGQGEAAWKSYLASFLIDVCKFVMTDVNGWLGRKNMFVISPQQLLKLITHAGKSVQSKPLGQILDIGAGNGEILDRFRHLWTQAFATELSPAMVASIQRKNITCYQYNLELPGALRAHDHNGNGATNEQRQSQPDDQQVSFASKIGSFDSVLLFNILDRCSRPKTLLSNAIKLLKSDGVLIVAVVLPFIPFVEARPSQSPSPSSSSSSSSVDNDKDPSTKESLFSDKKDSFYSYSNRIDEGYFEANVNKFYEKVFKPLNLNVKAWTRVPYLSGGDTYQQYYVLCNAVFVLECQS